MTTTESIKRAEQSLIALQKERASLEEMKRIAKESLTYLQVYISSCLNFKHHHYIVVSLLHVTEIKGLSKPRICSYTPL